MKLLKNLLFEKGKSSFNIFLILPILVGLTLGCLCSSDNSKLQTCITSDSSNLAVAGSNFKIIKLVDGTITTSDSTKYSNVLCANNNEIITIKDKSFVGENKTNYTERTALWQNSSNQFRLAKDEFLEKYHKFIQNKYFISSSRSFYSRSGLRTKTFTKVYDKPQVFNLEDLTNGNLKSQTITPDKLGLSLDFNQDLLRFYTLNVAEDGILFFAVSQKYFNDDVVNIFKLDMFSGKLTKVGNEIKYPKQLVENIISDKTGKFIALTYTDYSEKDQKTIVRGIDFETGRVIFTKTIEKVSFISKPKIVFEENGNKVAIFVYGLTGSSGSLTEVSVFELKNGNEIAKIDIPQIFKTISEPDLLNVLGDDLIITYFGETKFGKNESHICKLNLTNKEIIWDTAIGN